MPYTYCITTAKAKSLCCLDQPLGTNGSQKINHCVALTVALNECKISSCPVSRKNATGIEHEVGSTNSFPSTPHSFDTPESRRCTNNIPAQRYVIPTLTLTEVIRLKGGGVQTNLSVTVETSGGRGVVLVTCCACPKINNPIPSVKICVRRPRE